MSKSYVTPALVLDEKLKEYFLSHMYEGPTVAANIFKVRVPLRVFKKTRRSRNSTPYYSPNPAIVNLTIPEGGYVYANPGAFMLGSRMDYRKMRASKAIVHSVINPKTQKKLGSSRSDYDLHFVYKPGKIVTPSGFSYQDEICGAGIHFFLNVGDALNYYF